MTRVFSLPLFSHNFEDQLSSNFHRFVLCAYCEIHQVRRLVSENITKGVQCQWSIFGIQWFHFVNNNEVTQRTCPPPINQLIQHRRSAFFGQVARLADNIPAEKALSIAINSRGGLAPAPGWKRPRQRPPSVILGPTTWPAERNRPHVAWGCRTWTHEIGAMDPCCLCGLIDWLSFYDFVWMCLSKEVLQTTHSCSLCLYSSRWRRCHRLESLWNPFTLSSIRYQQKLPRYVFILLLCTVGWVLVIVKDQSSHLLYLNICLK